MFLLLYVLLAPPLAADTARYTHAGSRTQTGIICPSLVLLTLLALWADTSHFARAESLSDKMRNPIR